MSITEVIGPQVTSSHTWTVGSTCLDQGHAVILNAIKLSLTDNFPLNSMVMSHLNPDGGFG